MGKNGKEQIKEHITGPMHKAKGGEGWRVEGGGGNGDNCIPTTINKKIYPNAQHPILITGRLYPLGLWPQEMPSFSYSSFSMLPTDKRTEK